MFVLIYFIIIMASICHDACSFGSWWLCQLMSPLSKDETQIKKIVVPLLNIESLVAVDGKGMQSYDLILQELMSNSKEVVQNRVEFVCLHMVFMFVWKT